MAQQDIEDSLRIARREHQLALERRDDMSAGILERAITDLESLEGVQDPVEPRVVRLPARIALPRQRAADDDARQSGEVS